ncbi:hypothetical protein BRCON_2138 [Candidatus Sumerlaea chitinivorans]|uniref:Uncharacterized protein n=1 Tax=Sumerlaea chitinivorans TaxID=2250252 RepID=A0A2Z4Y921_SUMC1|nr:hypothetical protein BRCON_2138 [Candidatus Sumerlaea chitinivorans]
MPTKMRTQAESMRDVGESLAFGGLRLFLGTELRHIIGDVMHGSGV